MSTDASRFIPIAAPEIGPEEEAAVIDVLRSGRLAQGPQVEALEAAFAAAQGIEHVVAVANGTAALQTALHVAGIGSGDEVLVPTFTFAASANAVLAVGARPVFVDIDDDYLIDLDDAAARVTDSTAAIMPVHLYGLMVDMVEVASVAEPAGLAVIEDAAQAHLATRNGVAAGETGVGAFSLYATKNMMTGEGGLVTTQDSAIAEAARLFRNHGMATRYEHISWGLNLRMTDLQAAIGRVQLNHLPAWTKRRNAIAERYTADLPALFTTPRVPDGARHVFHQYTVSVDPAIRDNAVDQFRQRGVGVDIYYPKPVHRQPAFIETGAIADCPRADRAASSVICLPVHPGVTDDDVDRIIDEATQIAAELS